MKNYYNTVTKTKLSEEQFNALPEEEKKNCREWKENRGRGNKPKKGRQDYSWYNISDQISEAVGNIPYNVFAGTQLTDAVGKLEIKTSGEIVVDMSGHTVPGVLVVRYVPALGVSNNAVSGLNTAIRAVYTWVRHQNAGKTNYEAPDLGVYLGAMSNIYAAFQEATRVYDAAMTYLYDNRYLGEGLLQAMGVDIANILANLADFRYGLNLLAAKISSLCVPAKFSLFLRHAFISKNVFMDANSTRGQIYMFLAEGHLSYQPTADANGGSLVEVQSWSNKSKTATYKDILSYVSGLLDSVLQDEDSNIMSGDILKAYGRENCYTMEFISEDSTINALFNEDVLQQIENAVSYKGLHESYHSETIATSCIGLKYTQQATSATDNYLVSSITSLSENGSYNFVGSYYFNSHKDKPTYQNNIEWVRDNTCASWDSELVTGFEIVYNQFAQNGARTVSRTSIGTIFHVTAHTSVEDMIVLTMYSKFDWAPMLYVVADRQMVTEGPITPYFTGVMADLKVFTIIEEANVSAMHEASISGLMGKLTMSSR